MLLTPSGPFFLESLPHPSDGLGRGIRSMTMLAQRDGLDVEVMPAVEPDPGRRMELIDMHLRPPEPHLLDTSVLQNRGGPIRLNTNRATISGDLRG
jgi:hypothetical protein